MTGPANGGVGVDSTTTYSGLVGHFGGLSGTADYGNILGVYDGYPGLGYHYLSWNERGSGAGTNDWRGDDGSTTQAGLSAHIMN